MSRAKPLHVADVSRGELAGFARPRAVHDPAYPADDEPDSAPGPGLVEGDDVVIDAAPAAARLTPWLSSPRGS